MKRREFSKFTGTVLITALTGCGSRSENTEIAPTPTPQIITNASIELAQLLSSHPVVKLLSFLRIIGNAINDIAYNTRYNDKGDRVEIKTQNPGVDAIVSVATDDGEVTIKTPADTITFVPNYFMRVNNLTYGDVNKVDELASQLLVHYTQCTDLVLDAGERNHTRMLELRIACFEERGLEKTNLDYMRIRHEKFIQV